MPLPALREGVTLDDWRAIVARAVNDAKAGKRTAREWLSRYLLPSDSEVLDCQPMPQVILTCPDNGRGPKRAELATHSQQA